MPVRVDVGQLLQLWRHDGFGLAQLAVRTRHADGGRVDFGIERRHHLAMLQPVEIVAPRCRPLVAHFQLIVFLKKTTTTKSASLSLLSLTL